MNQGVGSQPAANTDQPGGPTGPGQPAHLSPSSGPGMMPIAEQGGYGGYHHNSPHSLPPTGYGGPAQFPPMFEQKIAQLTQGHKDSGAMFETHGGMFGGVHSPSGMEHGMSPPPPPRVYKPCVVCNDKSSGYHYGVSSCEGCKGFFRRSVQKNMQYTCHKDKNCPINKVTRNRCQYCRLQKCLTMGMSKEGTLQNSVRNDRNKKRKQKPESSSSSGASEELTEDDQLLIQDVLEAHRATTPALENGATPPVKSQEKPSDSPGQVGFLWEKVTELSSAGIVKIVDFAKKIPGFLSLTTSDQITLLKAACLEIMILRISQRYNTDKDMIQFTNGTWLNRDELQQGGFGPLTGTIFSFARSMKDMDSDETEFAMLSAICLISGDRSNLTDIEKIEQMQEPLLEALKHYVRSRRPEQPHLFAKMLMKLTDLRSISVKGEKQVLHFALDYLSMILDPVESKMQHEGTGPAPAEEGRGRVWPDVLDVPGPSGATATPAHYSPRQHPSSYHPTATATATCDSSVASTSGSRTLELHGSSSSRHSQHPTDTLHHGFLLSLDTRHPSSSHGAAHERLGYGDVGLRRKHFSGDSCDGRGSVGEGDPSSLGVLHSMVQKVQTSSSDPESSPSVLSPGHLTGRDSVPAVVVKSESCMAGVYPGEYDPSPLYMSDLRAAGRSMDTGMTGPHVDREVFMNRPYSAPTSNPVFPVFLHASQTLRHPVPPAHFLTPPDNSNESMPAAVTSAWRGVETGTSSGRSAVMPLGSGPEQLVASSGQARGPEREQNPLSISQLIGGAMKMEPGDWMNYEPH